MSKTVRWGIVAVLAVVLSVAVMTAPIAAGHTVVVSAHTSDTDFNNAQTLDGVTVQGSGNSAYVNYDPGAIESFEDGDIAEYGGDAGAFTVQNTDVHNGAYALDASSTTSQKVISDTGRTVSAGDTIEFWVKPGSGFAGAARVATQTETNTSHGYILTTRPKSSGGDSDLRLAVEDSGGTTTLATGGDLDPYAGTWIRVKYEWSSSGNMTMSAYDGSGTKIHSISAKDSQFSSGGIGWQVYDGSATFDHMKDLNADPGTYVSASHTADHVASGFTNISLSGTEATVTWQGHDGSSWVDVASQTYTTSGNKSMALSGGYSDWRVNVTFSDTGSNPDGELYDEGIKADTSAPTVDNASADPQGGVRVNSDPVTLSIDVNDTDFSTIQGDSVDVVFYGNGNKVGTDTLTSNGTASVNWSPELGNNKWYAEPTDDDGHSATSDTFKFETPSNITFRNEANASEIITGTTAELTFYSVSGTLVTQRTDSDGDGKIDLSGLPNTAFVVTSDVDGYYNRRIYIESIYDQQNIYLLNSTTHGGGGSVNTTFVYEDRTGQFGQSNTTLEIERSVDPDGDGNFEWQVVAGDFWGAAGEFPFTGQNQKRYRLRITNQETGESRTLGTHIPTSDGVKNIIVGKVVFAAENATGRYVDAGINSNTSNLQILYSDPSNSSTDVNIIVHEQGNQSNEIYNQTFSGPLGKKTITQPLTDNQTDTNYVVKFDVADTSDGSKFYKVVVGSGEFPLPIDEDILSAFVYVFITFVMLLYGPRTALLGAWAGVFIFAGAAFLGWVSGVTVVVPVLIAIGATFYSQGSV